MTFRSFSSLKKTMNLNYKESLPILVERQKEEVKKGVYKYKIVATYQSELKKEGRDLMALLG
jgi:hypothetical protein